MSLPPIYSHPHVSTKYVTRPETINPPAHRHAHYETSLRASHSITTQTSRSTMQNAPLNHFIPEYDTCWNGDIASDDYYYGMREEEMGIHKDVERAVRAQNRAKMTNVVGTNFLQMTSPSAHSLVPRASAVTMQSPPQLSQAFSGLKEHAVRNRTHSSAHHDNISRVRGSKFPLVDTKVLPKISGDSLRTAFSRSNNSGAHNRHRRYSTHGDVVRPLPVISSGRLAPLSRFNPFVRARSDSLSVVMEDKHYPGTAGGTTKSHAKPDRLRRNVE